MTRRITVIINPDHPKADKLLTVLARKIGPLYRGDGFWGCRSLKATVAVCRILDRHGIPYDTEIVRVVEGPHGDAVWNVNNKYGFGPTRRGYERVRGLLIANKINCA